MFKRIETYTRSVTLVVENQIILTVVLHCQNHIKYKLLVLHYKDTFVADFI